MADLHAPDSTLLIRVFDGVGVSVDGTPVEFKGARQRRLLALLTIRMGSVADIDWLAEAIAMRGIGVSSAR